GAEADEYLHSRELPSPDARYLIRNGQYRVLRPDWDSFIRRNQLCTQVENALYDDRTYVTALTGIGGVGKTALATWAVINAHEKRKFECIISVSAKDRELTSTGIRAAGAGLTSYESLLSEALDVLGFSEYAIEALPERERAVNDLLKGLR